METIIARIKKKINSPTEITLDKLYMVPISMIILLHYFYPFPLFRNLGSPTC